MAKKFTDLNALTSAAVADLLAIEDMSATETKKITLANFIASILTNQLDNPQLNEAVNMTSTSTMLNAIVSMQYGRLERSKFTYNGGATAYTVLVGPGAYTCKDKFASWAADLTTAAIGSPAADTWYYLYIDYSAITSHTALTDGTTELVWSDTAPTWNDTYRAWMNGDDRCIFAAMSNGTPDNILEFFHDGGDQVWYADGITDRSAADLDTTFTDVTLSIPAFTERASVTGYIGGSASANEPLMYWRTDGQTGTTGHILTVLGNSGVGSKGAGEGTVLASNQVIEIKLDASGAETAAIYTNSWFFPMGM